MERLAARAHRAESFVAIVPTMAALSPGLRECVATTADALWPELKRSVKSLPRSERKMALAAGKEIVATMPALAFVRSGGATLVTLDQLHAAFHDVIRSLPSEAARGILTHVLARADRAIIDALPEV